MTAEGLFSIANLVAVAGWILLIAAPRNRRATTIAGTLVPLLLAGLYVALLTAHWGDRRGGFSTLRGVSELFSNDWLLLAGWVHYLAFDLFVGTWETRDALERGLSRWLVVPCLLLTFLFGPAGWLAYRLVRAVRDGIAERSADDLTAA
jgi:ABA DEFICIENT 4-like